MHVEIYVLSSENIRFDNNCLLKSYERHNAHEANIDVSTISDLETSFTSSLD